MSNKFGFDCHLYRNTGTHGSPSWTEVTAAKDVTLNLNKNEVDLSTRAAAGWKMSAGGLKEASIEFDLVNPSSTEHNHFRDGWLNRTAVEYAVMDGPIGTTGSQGLRAVCECMSFNRDEKLSDAVSYKISLKPTPAAQNPDWLTI